LKFPAKVLFGLSLHKNFLMRRYIKRHLARLKLLLRRKKVWALPLWAALSVLVPRFRQRLNLFSTPKKQPSVALHGKKNWLGNTPPVQTLKPLSVRMLSVDCCLLLVRL
jgi:hypothetical protein